MNLWLTRAMIERAINILGLAGLARALGVSPQAVHKWRSSRVPAERCAEVEKATAGAVTRYDLRPDVFGPAPPTDKQVA